MSERLSRYGAVCLMLAAIGCTRGEQPVPQTSRNEASPPHLEAEVTPRPSVDPVSVQVIDERGLSKVISGYRGKVVLVDFWATWCLSCLELFPHTVALHERFAGDGLAVISVSFDEPDSKSTVLDFLRKHNARFDNFISRYGAGVESAERFHLPGALPQLLLYDRTGDLARTFPEPQSPVNPEEVDRAVQELLTAAP